MDTGSLENRHTTSAELSASSRKRASLSARNISAMWRSVTSRPTPSTSAPRQGSAGIDRPTRPIGRERWAAGQRSDVANDGVLGTQFGELQLEVGSCVRRQQFVQRSADGLRWREVAAVGPGRIAVQDRQIGEAEPDDALWQHIEHSLVVGLVDGWYHVTPGNRSLRGHRHRGRNVAKAPIGRSRQL